MSELIERLARELCVAEGVEPDLPCCGVGVGDADGGTVPAWRLRVRRVRVVAAEMVRVMRAHLEIGGVPTAWLDMSVDQFLRENGLDRPEQEPTERERPPIPHAQYQGMERAE